MESESEIRELDAYFEEKLNDAVIKRLMGFIAYRRGPGNDGSLVVAAVSEWMDRCRTDGISTDENILRSLCLIADRLIDDEAERVRS